MDDYENPNLQDTMFRASEYFFYGDGIGFLMGMLYAVQMLLTVVTTGIWVWGYHPVLVLPLIVIFIVIAIGLQLNKCSLALEIELEPLRRDYDLYRRCLAKYEHIKEIRVLGASVFFKNNWKIAMGEAFEKKEKELKRIILLRLVLNVVERLAMISAYLVCTVLTQNNVIRIEQVGGLIVLLGHFLQKS